MKKSIATIAAALGLWMTTPVIANAEQVTVTNFKHEDDRYYYETLNSHDVAYYKYNIPANTFGVFTLKNNSGSSNFDIYVLSNHSGKWELLAEGENQGTQTELIVIPPVFGKDRDAYIKIVNRGTQPSKYHFYANYVSPLNKMGIAFLETSFSCSLEKSTNNNQLSSTLVTGISSVLQGNDLTGVGQDLVITQVTNAMRNEFGYGCLGDFVVNTSVSIIKGFYRNYF